MGIKLITAILMNDYNNSNVELHEIIYDESINIDVR